ncbi:MAG: hypothetical protein KKG09_00530 [Verrucomicrobia bacterium]|nr:hypothetical protein [Actinomycetota bacterium]MBU4199700.1 hypothetical protein [Verrucomicrobiota bacterium]MCG2678490.1 hypothetical protein [Kiritimatiellia bacterium]MBU4247996.1 hypothetical protein [Verrucomicrobiota bacterium]MBU4289583.1 hypothetical protein [Verrucomicrobiota bacterium]
MEEGGCREQDFIFHVLVGIMTVIIGFAKLENNEMVSGIGAFVGGGLAALAMLFVTITGKVPTLLAGWGQSRAPARPAATHTSSAGAAGLGPVA